MNNQIMEIITNNILFDDNIKERNLCSLAELHEEIKNAIYDVGVLIELQEADLKDIYILLKEVILLNETILKQLNSIKNSKSAIDITKKTLILFYRYDCDISNILFPIWFKLKQSHKIKYNFLSINIDMSKYDKIIKIFDVKTTSLICLENNNIHYYNGKINFSSIINFINNIKNNIKNN